MVSIVTDLPGASEGAERLPAAAGMAVIGSIVGQARPVAEGCASARVGPHCAPAALVRVRG